MIPGPAVITQCGSIDPPTKGAPDESTPVLKKRYRARSGAAGQSQHHENQTNSLR